MSRFALVIMLLTSTVAHAQDAPHWEFNVTPYLWFGGVHSSFERVSPGMPPLRGKSDVTALLPHAEHAPAMIAGEVRYDRFSLGIDFNAIDANFGFARRTPPFLAGNADTHNLQTTIIASYRIVQTDQQGIDIGVGARIWSIRSILTSGRLASESHTLWADALFAGHYHLALPQHLGITLYGDIGGITGSKLTYQVLATVDYTLTNWLVFRAGYRYSFFDYRGSTIRRSATLNGPIIGATFRF